MSYKIDYNNLKYVTINNNIEYNFSESKDPITFLKEIKRGKMSLEETKFYQQDYLNYLNIIRKGNKMLNKEKP